MLQTKMLFYAGKKSSFNRRKIKPLWRKISVLCRMKT